MVASAMAQACRRHKWTMQNAPQGAFCFGGAGIVASIIE